MMRSSHATSTLSIHDYRHLSRVVVLDNACQHIYFHILENRTYGTVHTYLPALNPRIAPVSTPSVLDKLLCIFRASRRLLGWGVCRIGEGNGS